MSFELLFFFVWRDFLIRYKQAVLGIFWALIRPFLNLLIFVFIFQKIANVKTESPYPLFIIAGLLPWQFIASCIQSSSMSLIQNMTLIQKASFPRIFLPLSTCLVNLFDMLVALIVFLSVLFVIHPVAWDRFFIFPLIFLQLVLLGFAVSLWFSALSARFKDLVIVIPYLIQIGIFLCPIGFPSHFLSEAFFLNPLVGIIDGFRWGLLNEGQCFVSLGYSFLITLLLTVTGYKYFKRVELHLADFI